MLSLNPTALKLALDRANVQSLTPMFQAVALGDVLRSMPCHLIGYTLPTAENSTAEEMDLPTVASGQGGLVTADPYVDGAGLALYLPDDAKCALLVSAYGRTVATGGTGTVGGLTVDSGGQAVFAVPGAGHVNVQPCGDIAFNTADGWATVDAFYFPKKQDVYELTLSVAANVATIPTASPNYALVTSVLEAQALAGTVPGNKQINAVGTAPAATGQASLNAAKTQVSFFGADGVTSARVKFGVAPKVDVNLLLEQASIFI